MYDKYTILKQYFGHDGFRQGQEALVDALLEGRDVLGVMPTGAGKSICYQLPAVSLPGLTLVISPLISLMKDQVASLKTSGIPAAFVNSTLSAEEYTETLRLAREGVYKLIYVAPERLTAPAFARLCQSVRISLVAVDEAHCVSQWGQDFRPSYLNIARFIEGLPERPVVGAFTATATEAVKGDIVKLLELKDPFTLTTGFDRPNLYFDVVKPRKKLDWLLQYVRDHADQTGIVYCATRKGVEETCAKLIQSGVAATRYHAGLSDEERRQNQEDFVYDRVRVMVATNAFGMGIDKSNVGFVLHYNMPKNLESYYQEAGRAGRDGERAQCVLMFSAGDVQTAKFLIGTSSENEALSEEERANVYLQDMKRLAAMTAYCKTTGCFRANLLRYFGESAPDRCGYCGNCVGETVQTDITLEAQKILSGVARVEKRYATGLGVTMIIRMLTGSGEQRVHQLGLDRLPTYGIMAATNRTHIRACIDALAEQGYLSLGEGQYPVVRLNRAAWPVLKGEEKVYLTERVARKRAASPKRAGTVPNDSLYEALRACRMELARREGVPAYMIFSNAALSDMALKRPADMEELMQVSGVGSYKASHYGEAFLETIRDWEATQT